MIKRTIIPGPPGTGKTYRLVNTYLIEEVEKYNTPLKRVGFFTFSKEATRISVARATKLFNKIDYDEDLKYFCTLHALGTRECGIDTGTQLLKGKKWEAFKTYVGGIADKLNFETYATDEGTMVYGNDYIKLIKTKKIITSENATKRIQPASMDLTLSNECYELKYSFLCPKGKIRNKLETLSIKKYNLSHGLVFKKNSSNIFVSNILESLDFRNFKIK